MKLGNIFEIKTTKLHAHGGGGLIEFARLFGTTEMPMLFCYYFDYGKTPINQWIRAMYVYAENP